MPLSLGFTSSLLMIIGLSGLYRLVRIFLEYLTSPNRALKGPPSPSMLFGHSKVPESEDNATRHARWAEVYGHTYVTKSMFSVDRIYTQDTKALNHVLMNNYIYQKPVWSKFALSTIVGGGVLIAEDDLHKQQRRIMNPAFGASQIRELTEIFIEKSIQLRDTWKIECDKNSGPSRIEALSWLSKMTLDVIGLAGFNYKFDALSGKTSELNDAFSAIFETATNFSLIMLLKGTFPALRLIPGARDNDIKLARRKMNEIGRQLVQESKADSVKGQSSWTRRDLLSLLVRANTSTNIPPSQRMDEEQVLSQIPTFLVAGHETTSTGTAWALYALTQNIEAQKKLREELLTVGTDNPTMDELNSLPYLEKVVRESLRLYSPVSGTFRVASQDDFLPFDQPLKDKNGKMIHGIHVRKGQVVAVPIYAVNCSKDIWGADALEFKPDRWDDIPKAASGIPGVWGNILTFLGGPRACIGYRFSLIEMKALLFTLVRAFEFDLAVPGDEIIKKTFLFVRPSLRSNVEAGNQMPIIVRPAVSG